MRPILESVLSVLGWLPVKRVQSLSLPTLLWSYIYIINVTVTDSPGSTLSGKSLCNTMMFLSLTLLNSLKPFVCISQKAPKRNIFCKMTNWDQTLTPLNARICIHFSTLTYNPPKQRRHLQNNPHSPGTPQIFQIS